MKKTLALLLIAFVLLGCAPRLSNSASFATAEAANYTTLGKGSKGNAVKALQQRLIDLKYLDGKADGAYGDKTAKAVSDFQRTVGIVVSGTAGYQTQVLLFDGDAPSNSADPKSETSLNPVQSASANLFDDVFLVLASGIAKQSYNSVNAFLVATPFKVDSVSSSGNLTSHDVADDHGNRIGIQYFPIDNSYSSKDYGNLDKEVISLITYEVNNKSITITTGLHTNPVEFKTYDKSRATPNQSVANMQALLNFYQKEMGGALTPQSIAAASTFTWTAFSIESAFSNAMNKHFAKSAENSATLHGNNMVVRALGKDNIFRDMITKGMWKSIYDTLQDVKDVPGSVDFRISFPLVTATGQSSDVVVMTVTFSEQTRSSLNWKDFLFGDVPRVADDYWQHNAMPK